MLCLYSDFSCFARRPCPLLASRWHCHFQQTLHLSCAWGVVVAVGDLLGRGCHVRRDIAAGRRGCRIAGEDHCGEAVHWLAAQQMRCYSSRSYLELVAMRWVEMRSVELLPQVRNETAEDGEGATRKRRFRREHDTDNEVELQAAC